MANQFEITPVNGLQALLAQREGANAGYEQQLRPLQLEEMRGKIRGRDALSQMLQGGGAPDYDRLALGMIAAGDTGSASALASLSNAKASRALQERQIGLQERQAEEKPTYHVIQEEDASGNKRSRIVKLDPYGRGASYVDPSGAPTAAGAPTNPYSTGKSTETQTKFQLYANRILPAEQVIRDMEDQGTDWFQSGLSKIPLVGNMLIDPRRQALEQAQRDFINAVLRPESGATIQPHEFENARKQYFPQPGDSKDTIANKRRSRMEEIKGIVGGAGPAYRPSATFDESGELIRTAPGALGPPNASAPAMRQAGALAPIQGGPAGAPARAASSDQAGILERAQDALRRGAEPAAVAKRLMDNGINPDELGLSWQSP